MLEGLPSPHSYEIVPDFRPEVGSRRKVPSACPVLSLTFHWIPSRIWVRSGIAEESRWLYLDPWVGDRMSMIPALPSTKRVPMDGFLGPVYDYLSMFRGKGKSEQVTEMCRWLITTL
jgi:hypothetical protein